MNFSITSAPTPSCRAAAYTMARSFLERRSRDGLVCSVENQPE
jgi:hypothetical protein